VKTSDEVLNALYAVIEQRGAILKEPEGDSIHVWYKNGGVGAISVGGIQRWAERVAKWSPDEQRKAIEQVVKGMFDDGPAGGAAKR
jgi:hypothetical protein